MNSVSKVMRLGNIIEFRKDLYFEGAVQVDWFYDPEKAAKVAENFVFHGKDYFGVDAKRDCIDTVSLVKSLASKVGDESSNPRSLAIADYGTGKSHFAITLAQILSGPKYMPETYRKILNNIRLIDSEAASAIGDSTKDRNLVIVLNGIRDFNLHSEILKATQKSLRLYGVSDSALKSLNKTIDTAYRFFELNASARVDDFERAADARGWIEKGNQLLDKIRDSIGTDDVAFEIINDVYELTTGQRIRWEEGISAKAILEMLLSSYCGLNGQFDHVILLFDEFGRFLEYASGTDGGKCGDNALQEIFEVSQNSAGSLQIINFIQTDIKTYLLRVDPSRNLSRYIGRYDESEKYHISSNLETVFANLISRKDKQAFADKIVSWQSKEEEQWKSIFAKLNQWVQTKGIWCSYEKFRKVIVEGVYPMHPVSIFMLTQLSDYLQNRSSMTLVSEYISGVAEKDVDTEIPLVMPTDLMAGDLFVEMLAAETSGRHRSDNCIRFENVLKKNEQKLNANQIAVLRANLITRTLRFHTRTYEEAKESLMLCSGLTASEVEEALIILVDEYATMAFDETSGCFDFTEDAKGAYDYKIMKRRLVATHTVDMRVLLRTAKILDIAGVSENQPTNFGTQHKISTNEWNFKQELILAEDFTSSIAQKCISDWKNARSVVTPKGQLIWVYANKDTDYSEIEKLHAIAESFNGMPIVIMLLNDADNKLKNILTEYDALDHMDEKTKISYQSIFIKDQERITENLGATIETLKKNRCQITADGMKRWTKRLSAELTNLLNEIYPMVISYNFDALLTQANNFTGKGAQYYCQILKMLLSNKVNFDTIHDFQREIRNRIEALFMVENSSSWKCITKEYAMIPPLNENARKIYDLVSDELEKTEEYDCSKFFNTFTAPPYGLSEEAAVMFLGIVIVNQWHNIRIEDNGVRKTVTEWKDSVVDDKKLHLEAFKKIRILWVDTGSLEAKYQNLFKKINNVRDLDETLRLRAQLDEMIQFYGLPETQEVYNKLAQNRFRDVDDARVIWKTQMDDAENSLYKGEETENVPEVLSAIEALDSISIATIFGSRDIDVSDTYTQSKQELRQQAEKVLSQLIEPWVVRKLYCKNVDAIINFEKFYTCLSDRLSHLGYLEMSRMVTTKGEKEVRNKMEVKSRQELVGDGDRFIREYKHSSKIDYIETKRLLGEAADLMKRFQKFEIALGDQAIKLGKEIESATEQLKKRKDRMDKNMADVYDLVSDADNMEALDDAKETLDEVLQYRLNGGDRKEFLELKELIRNLLTDIAMINSKIENRQALEETIKSITEKYSDDKCEYDFRPVIDDCVIHARSAIDQKDAVWRRDNVTLGKESRKEVFDWKRKIERLPDFLSDETLQKIKELDKKADKLISDGKIEDVVYAFEKLNNEEKRQCITVLQGKIV